jgi:hypothetical protein
MSSLIPLAYKSLLRTQKFITFRNDPSSYQKAVGWNKEFIKKNITDPNLPKLLYELEAFLRQNIAQLETQGGRLQLKIHRDMEFSDKHSKFPTTQKCCQ